MKPSIKLITLCSSALLLFGSVKTNACCWFPEGEDYRFCVFNPMLAPAPELRPLIFTSDFIFNNYSNEIICDSVYHKNVDEWWQYMKGKVKKKDIYEFMYQTEPLRFLRDIPFSKLNDFVDYVKKNNAETYHYLRYAKACEQVVNYPDPWNEDEWGNGSMDEEAAIRLLNEGELFYSDTKDEFLKLHIAFQLERLFFYAGTITGVDDSKQKVYSDKIMKSRINSWIKGTAYYYATIEAMSKYYGYKNAAYGDYALSKAFDRALDKRYCCVQMFDRKNYQYALQLAKNNHEKAVMEVMYQLRNPGKSLDAMQNIYALDPGNKYIPFLLLREVNKLEDWVEGVKLTNLGSPTIYLRKDITYKEYARYEATYYNGAYSLERWTKDLEYVANVNHFVKQIADGGKQHDVTLLGLIQAHLCILQNDTNGALAALTAAQKGVMNAEQKKQVDICMLMLKIVSNPNINAETEKQIMNMCKGNDGKSWRGDEEIDTMPALSDQVLLFAGRTMMEHGNYAKGLLLLNYSGCILGTFPDYSVCDAGLLNTYQLMFYYATPKEYKAVLALLDKKDKTPFEKFLVKGKVTDDPEYGAWVNDSASPARPFSKYKVLDYEAKYYIQRDSLEPALEALNQIPDSYWKGEPYCDIKRYDPFRVDYVDHVVDSVKPDKGNWNLRTIVARIIQLKAEVETNPKKRATDYKLLANAYYNMSYYGKFWIMNRISWSSGELYEDRQDKLTWPAGFRDMYYRCAQAKKYYLLAAQCGHDFESTSFCYYMAGECKKNADYIAWLQLPNHYFRNEFKEKDEYPYLASLKRAFPDIEKRLSTRDTTDCTMFEDFLAAADPNNKPSD